MEHRFFTTGAEDRLQAYLQRLCEPAPLRALTKQEWIARRGEVRPQLLQAVGLNPAPDRVSLETRGGEPRELTGYSVQGVAWQTWPRVWAQGLLYRPSTPQDKGPAVLTGCADAADLGFHTLVAALAVCGYTVLVPARSQAQDLSRGLLPLTVDTWTHLRGLDLLASLPEVDREKLGLIGLGEAGVEAALAFGLEDRPRAAVLSARVEAPAIPGLLRFSSWAEVHALPSPRALLLLEEGESRGESLRESLRAVYRLWQQPDRLEALQGPSLASRETREAIYSWLQRELRGDRSGGRVTEPEVELLTPGELQALGVTVEGDRGEEGIREWFDKRVTAQPPQLESRQSRRNYQERARAELRGVLGEGAPATLDAERGPREEAGGQYLALRSEMDVRLPALWLEADGTGPHPTLVACLESGKRDAVHHPLVRALREAGWSILAPDVRFRGELELVEGAMPGRDCGRPEAGMAADDVRACVQWCFEQEGVDFRTIVLLGEGQLGVAALLAAALDDRVAGVIASCQGTTYRDGGDLPLIPNVLRVADVPQMASLVAPRPLWLFDVPAERVGFSSRRYYDWTRRTYQSLGDEEALKMSSDPDPDPAALLAWLEPRLKRQAKRRSF